MITHWGMSQKLGPMNFGERVGNDFLGNEYSMGREHSPETQREIDQEAGSILAAQHARARAILTEHRELAERVTVALLRYETITKEEFKSLVDGATPESLRKDGFDPESGGQRKGPPPLPARAGAPAVPPPPLPTATRPSPGGAA